MNKTSNISGEIIFVTGEQKNAGKTTFLKHLLLEARDKKQKFIVASVGVDGEKCDQIYGSEKPEVLLEKGDMVITTEEAINNSSADFAIIDVFENEKYNRKERGVLAQVIRSGTVEMISVGSNLVLSTILSSAISQANPDIIFIDGAADRVTQIVSAEKALFYYVVKLDNANFDSAIANIKKLDMLSQLPAYEQQADSFKISGALVKSKLSDVPSDIKNIVIDDFTKVFLSFHELRALIKKWQLLVEKSYNLKAVVVINNNVAQSQVIEAVNNQEIIAKIIFNPYERF